MDFGLQRKQVGSGSWIREETMETGADPMCFQGEEFSILKKSSCKIFFWPRGNPQNHPKALLCWHEILAKTRTNSLVNLWWEIHQPHKWRIWHSHPARCSLFRCAMDFWWPYTHSVRVWCVSGYGWLSDRQKTHFLAQNQRFRSTV